MTACRMPALVASMKNSSKNLVRTAMLSVIRWTPAGEPSLSSSRSAGDNSPVASRVNRSRPTARTSGSAYGSLISGVSALLAIARAAATMVAVAPTLDAKSQVSSSVRAIAASLRVPSDYLANITSLPRCGKAT